MNFFPQVAIPSYKRSDIICKRTLAYLCYIGYDPKQITIFVADEKEKEAYSAIPSYLYGTIVVAAPGLANARNFITDYYREGEWVLQMDDDVYSIKDKKNNQHAVLSWIIAAIDKAERNNVELVGIMPNDDKRVMSDVWTTHLTHIIGSFFLFKNRKSLRITKDEKEDYERCILSFLHCKKILRYRGLGVYTTYNSGTLGTGLLTVDRPQKMLEGVQNLVNKYPEMCKAITKKGLPDIRLNWRFDRPIKQGLIAVEEASEPLFS
jgi:hypothetical protein